MWLISEYSKQTTVLNPREIWVVLRFLTVCPDHTATPFKGKNKALQTLLRQVAKFFQPDNP
jgi:hypothetical protein